MTTPLRKDCIAAMNVIIWQSLVNKTCWTLESEQLEHQGVQTECLLENME